MHITTNEHHNELILDNRKVTAVFKSKSFRYKAAPLVVAKGHVEVDLKEIEIQDGFEFLTQKLKDGHRVPAVKPRDVKVKINRHNIKIHLHGNLISDIGDLFTGFFKKTVCDSIE